MASNSKRRFVVPSNQWRYYVGMSSAFKPSYSKPAEKVYVDTLNIHLGLHGIESEEELAMIVDMHQKQDPHFRLLNNKYADQLSKSLTLNFMDNSIKSRNQIYTLFIHVVTNPYSPQIWRRIKVSSKISLKQLDKILLECIGYRQMHFTEFQIPINAFHHDSIPESPPYRFIKNKLQIWDVKTRKNFVDSNCFHYFQSEITPSIYRILFGQIAHLFPVKHEFKGKYPFDAFQAKYYSKDKKYKQRLKNLQCDDKMRFSNFSYHRDDCLHWIYDLGNQWHSNIYIENVENNEDGVMCEYLNGSTFAPPDDIGNFEDWYLCLLKLEGSYKQKINDFKTKNDIYKWLKESSKYYYDMICLGYSFKNKPKWNVYFDIFPLIKSVICERNEIFVKINKSKKMKRRRFNIRKMRFCLQCFEDTCPLKVCSKCKAHYYCSRKCQKIHWNKQHRYHCI